MIDLVPQLGNELSNTFANIMIIIQGVVAVGFLILLYFSYERKRND